MCFYTIQLKKTDFDLNPINRPALAPTQTYFGWRVLCPRDTINKTLSETWTEGEDTAGEA